MAKLFSVLVNLFPRFGSAAIVSLLLVWSSSAQASSVSVSVLEDNPARTVLRFETLSYAFDEAKPSRTNHVRVSLGRESRSKELGAPELPTIARSVLIDAAAEVSATVTAAQFHEISDVDVAPSKGILYRSTDNPEEVPHSFGPSYEHDAFYPGELVDLGRPYLLRHHRGVVVTAQPFQYNPVTRVLRVYEVLEITVEAMAASGANPLVGGPVGINRSFEQIASRHFVNHGNKAAYAPLDENGDMLIIAADSWLSNVQPLVAHKNAIGIPTTAVGVSIVGNSSGQIKSYIQQAYNGGNLAFVLLVGEAKHVATPYASGGAADATYATVAGNDDYPDIFIGRFSANSGAHVDTQVQRSIDYEVGQATQQLWFKRGTGIGSYEGPGDDNEYDYQHIDKIRDDLIGKGYSEVDQLYGPGATSSQFISALNQGRGIVNYAGHGNPATFGTTGFGVGSVSSLNNTDKLPFVLSVACNTGEHDTGTCLSEAMLRSTKGGQAIGAIGMYASSISQSWDPPMAAQDETVDLLVAESYLTLGALCFGGSAKMIDEYGSGGADMFDTWHLFGDPSLRVVGTVQPPSGISVSPSDDFVTQGPFGGPFSLQQMTYTVKNFGESPVDVSISSAASWLDINPLAVKVPAQGSVDVMVSVNPSSATLSDGHWPSTIAFVNQTDHEGDTTLGASVTVGTPSVILEWPLDEDPGWTTEGEWRFGKPSGNGGGKLGSPDPSSGHTGQNVYGYDLDGNYPNDLPERHLTTTAIDCRELSSVRLRFWRWLNVEETQYDHAYVSVSRDGQNFTTVWENGGDLTDSSWQEIEIDVSEIADGESSVYFRWTMGSTDEGLTASGWNIDDIALIGFEESCEDGDGDGVLRPECGGDDCNDADAQIRPGVGEICDDGIDNDCDGAIDAKDIDCGGDDGSEGGEEGGDGDDGPPRLWQPGCGCRAAPAPASWYGLVMLGLLGVLGWRRRESSACPAAE